MGKRSTGMTLIELMIVVAIVAILAAVAYPSYAAYVRRANRTDATSLLLRVAAAQEKFYVQNNSYANTAQITALGLNASENNWYSVAITTAGGLATDFTATATANAGGRQNSDTECRTFTIDSTGARNAFSSSSTANRDICWR